MVSALSLKIMFFVLIIFGVLFEVTGDIFFKKWGLGNRNYFLAFGLIVYFVGSLFWAISLKYEFLSKAVSIFTVLNLILVVLAGVIIFKEDLSLVNKVGIGLGILSVVLIEI